MSSHGNDNCLGWRPGGNVLYHLWIYEAILVLSIDLPPCFYHLIQLYMALLLCKCLKLESKCLCFLHFTVRLNLNWMFCIKQLNPVDQIITVSNYNSIKFYCFENFFVQWCSFAYTGIFVGIFSSFASTVFFSACYNQF